MARVTVEDCIDKVPNRFELVLLAGHRARAISAGSPITVERDDDKPSVIALREIAEETICSEDVKEDLIHSKQKYVEVDEPEPEAVAALTSDLGGPIIGQDTLVEEPVADRMSEEELLRGLESIAPPDLSNAPSRGR